MNSIRTLTVASSILAFSLLSLPGCNGGKQAAMEKAPSTEASQMPWENPGYETNIRATQANGRPAETWTLWTHHH